MKPLTLFIPSGNPEILSRNLNEFLSSELVEKVYILIPEGVTIQIPDETYTLAVDSLHSSNTVKKIAFQADTAYTLLYTKNQPLSVGLSSLHRMIQVAESTNAGMLYSDYFAIKDNVTYPAPVIDYQEGSLRDDFNFGSLLLFNTNALKESVSRMKCNSNHAGFYDMRLKLSQKHSLFHLPEFLYTEIESDTRKSGEKQFDYVDPRNRSVQIEMEQACTEHLKETGAWLQPIFTEIDFKEGDYPVEASVIIPVKNRVSTIGDAVNSVMSQKTSFRFNLILVDNHSTDGTTSFIKQHYSSNPNLIHVIPERSDLGIGGCWNQAVFHPGCGRFSIQLDSDDLYIDDQVVERIVNGFYEQQCAMLVGSYRMVNFSLEEIPPGIIDHREWTPDNGRNNALRINGFGAPRAFFTTLLRKIRIPDVSYGEDYAVGLNISRYYRIGRIYDPLYLCRRWEGNSDAALDVHKLNNYNFYKDKIRTIEYKARQNYVKKGQA